MKRRTVLTALGAAALSGCAGIKPASQQDAYVFAYFIDNGQDGLHLAGSRDGYHWEALGGGRSYLLPSVGKAKLMRDPGIVRGPDGTFNSCADWRAASA
jgi:hypothetical protein